MMDEPRDVPSLGDITDELRRLGPMELELRPVTVLQWVGLFQLALRHPGLPFTSREAAERFLTTACGYFADAPAVLALIEAGDDPANDVRP